MLFKKFTPFFSPTIDDIHSFQQIHIFSLFSTFQMTPWARYGEQSQVVSSTFVTNILMAGYFFSFQSALWAPRFNHPNQMVGYIEDVLYTWGPFHFSSQPLRCYSVKATRNFLRAPSPESHLRMNH